MMQIRELDLKELYTAYDVVCELRSELSYKEFEDLIYDMRHIEYKMFGIFEGEELITYAGASVLTTLKDKRHLRVYDFITSKRFDVKKNDLIMKEYLEDFSRVAMCEKVIYE